MAGFQIPQSRQIRQIDIPKRKIPVDQIINIQGENPMANAIDAIGKTIGSVLTQRAQRKQQGDELAQLSSMTGVPVAPGANFPAKDYISGVGARAETIKAEADRAKANKPEPGYVVPNLDENGEIIGFTPVPAGMKPTSFARPPKPDKPATPSRNFIGNDAQGNPLFADKEGNISLGKVPGAGGHVLPKTSTMPTSQTRASGEFADTLMPHIQHMRELIQAADAKGYIGPAAGRGYSDFLVGKVGTTGNPEADNLLGELRATDSLVKTAAMKVHFGSRGGQEMYDHFSNMLNTGRQSAAVLNGSLNGIQSFMQGYSDAAKPKGGTGAAARPSLRTLPPAGTVDLGGGFTYKVKK